MFFPRRMNALSRVLLFLSAITNTPSVSEYTSTSDDGNHETEYQSDDRHQVDHSLTTLEETPSTPKTTIEEAQSVSDFDNTSSRNHEKGHRSHAHTSPTCEGKLSTSKPTTIQSESDGGNHIPGYRHFFISDVKYQDLLSVLGPVVSPIVEDPSMWHYTRDFAKRIRMLREDAQAKLLLEFIDGRIHIPEFRDKLLTTLEAQSDLNGFLKKPTW